MVAYLLLRSHRNQRDSNVHCCDIHEHAIIRDGIKPTEALDLDQMYYFLIPDLGGNFVGLSERLLCGNFDGSAVGIEAEGEASPMLQHICGHREWSWPTTRRNFVIRA